MSFVTALALAIGLLVVAPFLAHRLRRQEAEVRPFAPAKLVPPTPPKARRRSKLEDRALLTVRALAVIALAVLGASPLVRCSHLALDREGGASVALAIVLDDSASMRAPGPSGKTRFAVAKAGALQLLATAREGDAVAVVLAGSPPRVLLAPTTDLVTVQATLDEAEASDRPTDLDASVALAEGLLGELPHIDKKVVLLSDLADGKPDGPPLKGSKVPLFTPLPALAGKVTDCAVISADRSASSVRVKVACTPGETFATRQVSLRAGGKVLGTAQGVVAQTAEVSIPVAADAPPDLVATLEGSDAVHENDTADVLTDIGPSAIAVVGDPSTETTVTGGAPVVEQAFAALHTELTIRPIPQVPDRTEDLAAFAGLVVDDPPGMTPEQRRAVATFLQGGGVALFALGPRAAQAQLGSTLEPLVQQGVTWSKNPSLGASKESASALFAEPAESLGDLGAQERITLGQSDLGSLETLLAFTDKAPLVARKTVGAGEAWIVTLPFSVNDSDLVLRPGFLTLLDNFADVARKHTTLRRSEVGASWLLRGVRVGEVRGPNGRVVPTVRDAEGLRVSPGLVGRYTLTLDGRNEIRVVQPSVRELDTRPRAAESSNQGRSGAGVRTQAEASWVVALVLLALVAAEIVLRVVTKRSGVETASATPPASPAT